MTTIFPWFAARILFEARVEGEESSSLYEDRIVLVRADSGIDAAWKKAVKLGQSAADQYENEAGEKVAWVFKEVLDVVQLNEMDVGEGSEVYHHYLSSEEVERVRASLRPGSL
jgi:hypothetical protein